MKRPAPRTALPREERAIRIASAVAARRARIEWLKTLKNTRAPVAAGAGKENE